MHSRFVTEADLNAAQARVLYSVRQSIASSMVHYEADGGVKTAVVREAITPGLERLGFSRTSTPGIYMDDEGTAVTIHGGRAHTNNEAVWRVIQLAGDPNVRSVVTAVPRVYKGGSCAPKVAEQIHELAANNGVGLDLVWVAHAPFNA